MDKIKYIEKGYYDERGIDYDTGWDNEKNGYFVGLANEDTAIVLNRLGVVSKVPLSRIKFCMEEAKCQE